MPTEAEVTKTVGNRLRAVMQYRSMPPADLALAMGIDERRLGRIFRGGEAASLAQLLRAAKALGTTTSVLTGEVNFSTVTVRPGDPVTYGN